MKTHFFLFPVALCFLLLTGCELFDDSPCGLRKSLDIYLLGSSIVDTTFGYYYSYMDGNNRVFQYSEIVENVCASEHVKTEFRVALLDETTVGINARGNVSWLFLFEERVAMVKNGTDIEGNVEAGLKQAFGEEPGWYVPALEVYFPTKGNYHLDTAFLKEMVISVEVTSKYRDHSK
ncbi:MAG: hypothetical protein WAT79_04320 [Saprospiraceae bacterium]